MSDKIIIIGAGIIGASIAYHLAKAGGDVTVIEKAVPATGASSKSFAWINAHYANSHDYYRLRMASIDAYRTLERELDDENFKVDWCGSLSWELSGDERAQQIKALTGFGSNPLNVSSAEFTTLEPAIRNPDVETCLRMENEAAIDPVAATHALLQAATRHGTRLNYGCEAMDFTIENNCITGIETSAGHHACTQIVSTVGVQTQALLAKANAHLPMNNAYGLIVHTKPVPRILSHVIITSDIHFRQQLDGTFLVGESFSGGEISNDTFEIADKIMARLKYHLPNTQGLEIDYAAFGNRPMPQDGLPAVGVIGDVAGLYVATMHSGITLAPIIGKLAAEEILQGTKSDLLAPYRPQRFT